MEVQRLRSRQFRYLSCSNISHPSIQALCALQVSSTFDHGAVVPPDYKNRFGGQAAVRCCPSNARSRPKLSKPYACNTEYYDSLVSAPSFLNFTASRTNEGHSQCGNADCRLMEFKLQSIVDYESQTSFVSDCRARGVKILISLECSCTSYGPIDTAWYRRRNQPSYSEDSRQRGRDIVYCLLSRSRFKVSVPVLPEAQTSRALSRLIKLHAMGHGCVNLPDTLFFSNTRNTQNLALCDSHQARRTNPIQPALSCRGDMTYCKVRQPGNRLVQSIRAQVSLPGCQSSQILAVKHLVS